MQPQNETYDFQIIANLMAGKGESKIVLESLKSFLAKNNKSFKILAIDKPTPISKLPNNGFRIREAIICIGGDGTVSETIGFILKQKLDLPLAIIPTGTANFIAGAFGIEKNSQNFSYLLKKRTKRVDIGLADYEIDKYFFMLGLGIGFEEKFLKITKEKFKSKMGIFSYILVALSELLSLKRIPIVIKLKNRELKINISTLIVLKTPPKILKIFPLFKDKSRSESSGLLNLKYVVYKNYFQAFFGTLALHILGEKNFGLVKSIKEENFLLESPTLVGTQIDGELRGNLPVKISLLPEAFEFWI